MSKKVVKITAIIISYLFGLLVSVSGSFYILLHSGGHGGGKGMWYDIILISGIYIAVAAPPFGVFLAIFLYTLVIGSLIYLPFKFTFRW